MNKLPKILLSICFFCAAHLWSTTAVAAPRIFFDPASVIIAQDNEFIVALKIDAEGNQVVGSDATVSFAGGDLDIVTVTNGGYFPEFGSANNGNSGRLEIHGYVTSTYQSKTGAGTLATIKFKSKKSSGSSAVSFECAGSGNDTNIIDVGGQNLLSCNSVNQIAVSYTSQGSNNTPTPTTPPGVTTPTRTPTPTNVPGNTIPSCTSLTSNITQATGAPLSVTLTCTGSDPGGTITAAEFTFGDGTKQLVERSVGTSGSIATSHTYTTIGTLGASCRVRDNTGAFSITPTVCNRTITISPRPSPTPSPRTTITTSFGTANPTPTIAVVAIISDTPFPTFAPPIPTDPLYGDGKQQSARRPWWAIGGIIALFTAYVLLRRRKKRPPMPPPMPPIIVQEMPNVP